MPQVIYELDSSIAAFFSDSGTSATRQQCDEFARNQFGEDIRPVPLQGVTSYTVTAGPITIVQFREQGSSLNEGMMALAKAVHGDVVTGCVSHGLIGGSSSYSEGKEDANALALYSMDKLPGENYIFIRASLAESLPLQLATVESLARFFAQSWLNGRTTDPDQVSTAINNCTKLFHHLSETLPSRFQPSISQLPKLLNSLRSGEHPVVLTHGDLNEMNILVDPVTGKITSVVDWAEASFLPFGFALYALDNCLGNMGENGWEYFDNADQLRKGFWDTFDRLVGGLSESVMESIRLARVAGLFIRYGIAYEERSGGMM
ncbi:uncharacterized protein C8A04DRAFT_27248 [Dichotomopilus funicola]|uniref:Aminoglycoside phosphotransferase domain-containing protein n=1 Tax=Dichotomopilus funicola TaxID=1934379 RepID=A0AAN6V562_9PEZI|nr:hypothetical protein C8A04DRAFT_27248 [Dichotomopilus funicola]